MDTPTFITQLLHASCPRNARKHTLHTMLIVIIEFMRTSVSSYTGTCTCTLKGPVWYLTYISVSLQSLPVCGWATSKESQHLRWHNSANNKGAFRLTAINRESHSHLCFCPLINTVQKYPVCFFTMANKMAIKAAHLLGRARGITLLSPFPPRRVLAVNLSHRK